MNSYAPRPQIVRIKSVWVIFSCSHTKRIAHVFEIMANCSRALEVVSHCQRNRLHLGTCDASCHHQSAGSCTGWREEKWYKTNSLSSERIVVFQCRICSVRGASSQICLVCRLKDNKMEQSAKEFVLQAICCVLAPRARLIWDVSRHLHIPLLFAAANLQGTIFKDNELCGV